METPSIARRLGKNESQIWRAAVKNLVAAEDRDNELLSTSEAESALMDDRCYLIVVEADSSVVGLLSAYRFPDLESGGHLVYLYDIEVGISHRKRGYGSMLIDSLLEHSRIDDAELIWAGTDAGNISARRLFERSGASLEGNTYTEYEWDIEKSRDT